MIHQVISSIKLLSTLKINKEQNKILAANKIEHLLNQIDFDSEVLPIDDSEELIQLLSSLNNEALTEKEVEMIQEISVTKMNLF
ncbi:hypothetical protein SAMN06265371_107213 [Lutibacter agarilyticus]|uniref:Uncharacterized protein n=1 Tax=Lutibacter agarilyticus TaxID=1109740 RepID=A0A238Y0K4_9FLAO|nr:hypothetical protein [Lutibacter agarilyticus]SNR64755.1 hypothetical protein SAMN06265371_107213 [Lutibacter agarilyticus]